MNRNPSFPKIKNELRDAIYERSFWCREYDRCLSEAAFNNSDLDCSKCPHKSAGISLFRNVTTYHVDFRQC